MEKKVKGAWIIHHTHKLQNVTNQNEYQKTFLAGKAGTLLTAISANEEIELSLEKIDVLANASNINTTFELPQLISLLKKQGYIDTSEKSVSILGVTTSTVLSHTSDIFDNLNPTVKDHAYIQLAEHASQSPISSKDIHEKLSDTYKLDNEETSQLLVNAENIGFIDTEKISNDEKLYFNGNLFRRETSSKIKSVLDSLTPQEQINFNEVIDKLKKTVCIEVSIVKRMLGDSLFSKLTSVGLLDVSIVASNRDNTAFITLPSSFSKYSNSMIEDAFDLTKAFVSSLTYGMTKSEYERGQIQMISALLKTLVRGESVGPVPAIKHDYKLLELKGVVQVYHGSKKGRHGPMLRLLKKEVGELALQAIQQGDISEHSLNILPHSTVTSFKGPETNRETYRRIQVAKDPKSTHDMLQVLRTGTTNKF